MNSQLAVRTPINEQLAQAEWFAKSGFMPKHLDNAAKVYAVVTLGQELGLGPWSAINNIYLAGNKPTINANLMLALIQSSGALERFDAKVSETEAVVMMARRNVGSYTAQFSMADADRAGLLTGYNGQTWKKYPKAMLKARAISDCARTLFADVLLGMYTPEELGARVQVTEDGEMMVIEEPLPQPVPLTGDEARRLAKKWLDSAGLTGADLKAALGKASSAWTSGYEAADKRIAEWLKEQQAAAPDGEDADAEAAAEPEDAE